jgi:stringent starvation protein B
MDATSSLKLGNDFIEFKARFGGKPRDIMVPIHRVMAIYARENGQGMAFPITEDGAPVTTLSSVNLSEAQSTPEDEPTPPSASPSRPALKRIK